MMMVMRTRRAIRAVIIVVPIVFFMNRCLMVAVRITAMLNLDTGVYLTTLSHQQSATEPGKNAEHHEPCRDSKHAAKKHRFP
jgi:hypothetical protein